MTRKWTEPISFALDVSSEVERLFDEIIHRPWGFYGDVRRWNPSVDLYETTDAFVLVADLPGVKRDAVKVEVQDGYLLLEGNRFLEETEAYGRFYAMERSSGHFVRKMRLPESVDRENIRAEFKDGVLRVILPKVNIEDET